MRLLCVGAAEKLKGLVVWVTGASSGIGEETAYQLAKIGSKLILSSRREEELHRVKEQCVGEWGRREFLTSGGLLKHLFSSPQSARTCGRRTFSFFLWI